MSKSKAPAITQEQEVAVCNAYLSDPVAAEAFFAGLCGTEPRPERVVRESLGDLQNRIDAIRFAPPDDGSLPETTDLSEDEIAEAHGVGSTGPQQPE